MLKISKNKTIFLIMIILYPINIKIISILRPLDVFIFFVFFLLLVDGKLNRKFLNIHIVFLSISFVLSLINGLIFLENITISVRGLAFVFKYFEIFIILWIMNSVKLNNRDIDFLFKVSIYVFILINIYIYLRLIGIIPMIGGFRPDFPFTHFRNEANLQNAGHLMGAYLITGSIVIIIYMVNTEKNILFTLITSSILLTTIILSGSRAPVVVFLCCLLYYYFETYFFKFLISKYNFKFIFFFSMLVISISIYGYILYSNLQDSNPIKIVVERTFDFNFLRSNSSSNMTNASTDSRIEKMGMGFDNISNSNLLFGPGVFAFPTWFDNGIVRLLHDFGILPFIYLIFIVLKEVFSYKKKDSIYGNLLFYSFLAFSISNVSTEFFLVTRAFIPYILISFLCIKRINNDSTIKAVV